MGGLIVLTALYERAGWVGRLQLNPLLVLVFVLAGVAVRHALVAVGHDGRRGAAGTEASATENPEVTPDD